MVEREGGRVGERSGFGTFERNEAVAHLAECAAAVGADPDGSLGVLGEAFDAVVREAALGPPRGDPTVGMAIEPFGVGADPKVAIAVRQERGDENLRR